MSGGGASEDEDKQYEATPKKLEDARRKGEVPRSTDLITTGSYAGLVFAALVFGATSLGSVAETMSQFLSQFEEIGNLIEGGGGQAVAGGVLLELARDLVPWAAAPMALALVSIVGQQGFTVTSSKLQPKGSRISILSNAKNKFGRGGLFEFAKSTAKLTIFSGILIWYLITQMPDILATVAYEPGPVVGTLLHLASRFLILVLLVSLCIGAIDFMWQRAEHLRKNRMSRKDLTDEQKQAEGDPMMKQQRRQRGYEIAMNTMLADVPDAAVVVVNPTHYAVALKWDRGSVGAPVCVAKGVDQVAARIREVASEAGVPIHSDPPTARALHASVDIGAEIDAEHFAPIAVAIRFAEDMRRKASER